jgi:hypothetical protein
MPAGAKVGMALAAVLLAALAGVGVFVYLTKTPSNNDARTVNDLAAHFSRSGLSATVESKVYSRFGAAESWWVEIEGKSVGVHKFDAGDSAQREILERALADRSLSSLGRIYPVRVNGSFLLAQYEDHPKAQQIVRVFESF